MLGLEWPHYALRFLNSQIALFRRVKKYDLWNRILQKNRRNIQEDDRLIGRSGGESLKKGQLLFVIDARPFNAQLDSAQANLAQAKARWSWQKFNLLVIRSSLEPALSSSIERKPLYGKSIPKYNQKQRAGVVQWQNGSFPSFGRGFDSHRPLHKA